MPHATIAPTRSRFPSAIMGRGIRAEGDDARALISQIGANITEMRTRTESRLNDIEAHINASAASAAAAVLNGGIHDGQPTDPDYRATFASYLRAGSRDAETSLRELNATGNRQEIRASFSEGSNSAGGYIAPVEWDRQIRTSQRALSPLRRIAQVQVTNRNGYSTLWNNQGWGSGWVGETAERPLTGTPTFTPLVFPVGEIYAQPAATQRLLDDAAIDFEAWLARELGDEFSRQEGIAFVSGNGVNKPMGFLQYLPGGAADNSHPGGNIATTPTGDAAKVTLDSLIDIKYQLGAPYRQGAVWLFNSSTAGTLTKMKDLEGNLIWRESLVADQPPTLLGSPVVIDENMPDIAAGSTPIAYGNFRDGYLINDRLGVITIRDNLTMKPFVLFYSTKRVGGGLLDPKAIRLLKVSAS